jgi:hypothetical protein
MKLIILLKPNVFSFQGLFGSYIIKRINLLINTFFNVITNKLSEKNFYAPKTKFVYN